MVLEITRKRGNCKRIATWPPEPRQPFPAWITTPSQVWSR